MFIYEVYYVVQDHGYVTAECRGNFILHCVMLDHIALSAERLDMGDDIQRQIQPGQ